MRKLIIALGAAAVLQVGGVVPAPDPRLSALLPGASPAYAHFCAPADRNLRPVFGAGGTFPKVEVCHRTGSATNPYVLIKVNYHAVCRAHNEGHHEDVGGQPVTAEDILPEDFDTPAERAAVCVSDD